MLIARHAGTGRKMHIIETLRKFCTVFILFMPILVAGALPGTAAADTYPDKPVSLMVSYGAGGATDFQARIMTMVAGNDAYLKQPIVIINKPGAGGRKGWNWFAGKARKDGYDLAAYNVPHFIAQSIVEKVDYAITAFEPIANWGADPAVFIVPKSSTFGSLADVVAYSKKHPGKLTVSGAGILVGHHIAALQFQRASGIKFAYRPTKGGGAAAMKAVVNGDVMAGFNNLSDAYRALQSGSVKILGVADLERNSEFLPDVPTFREQGIDIDNSSVNYRGIMVPKGTPPATVDYLARQVLKMFQDRRVAKRMKASGSPIRIMSREKVRSMWVERQKYLKELLRGL
jgi:tripartite-type tricarboxylate transporter receptor subunit TctC